MSALTAFFVLNIVASTAVAAPCQHVDNRVPLVQLVANPERWDGKEVRVIGFARFQYEGDALFLSKEDYLNGLDDSAIFIDIRYDANHKPLDPTLDTKANDRRLVEIQGVFHANRGGFVSPVAANTGAIGPICMLQSWDLRGE